MNKPFSDEDFSCILPTENRPSAHISSSFRVDEFAKKMFSPGGSLSERLSQIKYIFGDRYFRYVFVVSALFLVFHLYSVARFLYSSLYFSLPDYSFLVVWNFAGFFKHHSEDSGDIEKS